MPGHSRSKNGVASLAYVPGIHKLEAIAERKTWMAGTSPAMTTQNFLTRSANSKTLPAYFNVAASVSENASSVRLSLSGVTEM